MKHIKLLLLVSFVQLFLASMVAAGSISGKVVSGAVNGEPVANIDVFAIDTLLTSTNVTVAKTNEQGEFTLNNLPAGKYRLAVDTKEYSGSTNVIELKENQDVTNIILVVYKPVDSFSNQVEGNVNDSQSGEGVSNAHVILIPKEPIPYFVDSYTDSNGDFTFLHIPVGEYKLIVEKYGYERFQHPETFDVKDTTKISGINISFVKATPNASLSGVFKDAKTNKPVKDVKVQLNFYDESGYSFIGDTNNYVAEVKTDDNGKYEIKDIFTGNYVLTASAKNYETIFKKIKVDGTTTLNFSLMPMVMGTVSGNVFNDDSKAPIENAYIQFIPLESIYKSYYGFAKSDKNGKYSVNIPTGKYYVNCNYLTKNGNKEFYYGEFYDNAKSLLEAKIITVEENKEIKNINFGLPSLKEFNIVLKGKVSDDKGNPIEDAVVTVFKNSFFNCGIDTNSSSLQLPLTKTAADGSFEVSLKQTSLAPVELKLLAEKDNYISEFYNGKADWFTADVISAHKDTIVNNLNFTLKPFVKTGNEISGTVTDVNGKPLENIVVFGQSISSLSNPLPTKMDFPMAITDADGNYKLDNLKPEEYVITFSGNKYITEIYDNVYTWEEATKVKAEGKVNNINAALDSYESISDTQKTSAKLISGNIYDDKQKPVYGALITLTDANGKAISSSRSSLNGTYTVFVNKNVNEIIVSKPGYTSTHKTVKDYSVVNLQLTHAVVDVSQNKVKLPGKFDLKQNYPNPFNPTTVISFNLPKTEKVQLEIYNVIGEKVSTLINKTMNAGTHNYEFNATNLNSGVYFYKISAGSFVQIKKMMLLK